MANETRKSIGVQYQYSTDSTDGITGTWTPGIKVVSIDPASDQHGDVDETYLTSADAYKEFSAGWGEGQDGKIKLHLTENQFDTLKNFKDARTSLWHRVQFAPVAAQAAGARLTVYGHYKGIDYDTIERGKNETLQVEFTIKQSGKAQFVKGS